MARPWRQSLPVAVAAGLLWAAQGADTTDWNSISPHLLTHWADSLPPLPQAPLDTSRWSPVPSRGAFQVVRADFSNATFCNATAAVAGGVWPTVGASAGPIVKCHDQSPCSGAFVSDVTCKANDTLNAREGVVALFQRHGTFWARLEAQPAWAQFRFPIPNRTGSVTFRLTMDERYPPLLRGGNPCQAAKHNQTHVCKLCTPEIHGGPWDHDAKAGVYILWSTPGLTGHMITGPVDALSAYATGELTIGIDSPAELDLSEATEVGVTVLAFNQYPFTGELVDGLNGYSEANPTKCSVDWTRNSTAEDLTSNGNVLLIVARAEIFTRSEWEPAIVPPNVRPRVLGADSDWMRLHNKPFYDSPCTYDKWVQPGWGGDAGVPDFKAAFERSTLGYATCFDSHEQKSIFEHPSVKKTYADATFKSFKNAITYNGALQVFHLIRRVRACLAEGRADCGYTANETSTLAKVVVEREFELFEPSARHRSDEHWGWEQDSDGCCGYDLFTAVPVKHFSLLVDILEADAAAVNSTRLEQIKAKMEEYIDKFLQAFDSGDWSLWNGNNWTPVLSAAATYWVIAFWHERNAKARKVMHDIVDISMLHKEMTVSDGVYIEGMCQYSYMSIRSSLELSVLYASAFGATFPGVNLTLMQDTARWHIDSIDMGGYTVDFGDSHACRGSDETTLYAAMAPTIASPPGAPVPAVSVDPCVFRVWCTAAYYLSVDDPFTFWPALAGLSPFAAPGALDGACGANPALPMGASTVRVYPVGGYGVFRLALPTNGTSSVALPDLDDVKRYTMLAVQGRPNEFPHSEVDFATISWTSHGMRLLGEHGYGTIATAVGPWDMRRFAQIDNNPAGHNTVVIRDAYESGSEEINFSQLHHRRGTITHRSDLGQCMHLDGSEVYGASRPNGWLAYMHRWICTVGESNFLVVDAFGTMPNRTKLELYGALYGGPNYNEGSAHAELDIDEYFHTSSWLNDKDVSTMTDAAKQFNRSLAGKWCSHVDVERSAAKNSTVFLRPRCGLDPWSNGSSMGRVTAWSANGGDFVLDGLVSAADRWGTPTLQKHRFRYASSAKVGAAGDVRAFLLDAWGAEELVPEVSLLPAACPPHLGAAGGCRVLAASVQGQRLQFALAVGEGGRAPRVATCRGACTSESDWMGATAWRPQGGEQCVPIAPEVEAFVASKGYRLVGCSQ